MVSHNEMIVAIRRFADELEAIPPENHPETYHIGGWQCRLFLEYGLEIYAKVIEKRIEIK